MGAWGVWDDANDLSREAYALLCEKLGFGRTAKEKIDREEEGLAEEARESCCQKLLLQHPSLFYGCLSDLIDFLDRDSSLPLRARMGRAVGLALEVYHLYNRDRPPGKEKLDPAFPSALRRKCLGYIQALSEEGEIREAGWSSPRERLRALAREAEIFAQA